MSYAFDQPFIDSQAFVRKTKSYVTFPSQTDAMLASLQLFHNVPCRIMNLVFSVVTHPNFDSKQVTLLDSADVIDVVEKSRLEERMAVVHKRSLNSDGYAEQAGFPQFALDEVLDIIHAERMERLKTQFGETLDPREMFLYSMRIEEDTTLKAMSLVHRSWATPAQKALGRVLLIGRPIEEMKVLRYPVRKSIFGPWTCAVAIQFYHPVMLKSDGSADFEYSTDVHASDHQEWFENLHGILVGFTNLKSLFIKSYTTLFTEWSNPTIREMIKRNKQLEEITLNAVHSVPFSLDPLIDIPGISKNLKTLNIQGAQFSDEAHEKAIQGPGFPCLSNLTISRSYQTLEEDFMIFSLLSAQSSSCLKSLRIIDNKGRFQSSKEARNFPLSPYANILKSLSVLYIHGSESTDEWLEWIIPHCSSLESLTIIDSSDWSGWRVKESIDRASTPQYTAVFGRLRSLHIDSRDSSDSWFEWIVLYCSSLESLSIIDRNEEVKPLNADTGRLSTPQSTVVLKHLCNLRIDSKNAPNVWTKWIGTYCSSLESLTIIDNGKGIPSDEDGITPPQIAVIFEHLSTLRIDSKGNADLWLQLISPCYSGLETLSVNDARNMSNRISIVYHPYLLRIDGDEATDLFMKWISPHCCSLKALNLKTHKPLPCYSLSIVPATTQTFGLQVLSLWRWEIGEITVWMNNFLNAVSSKQLSELKSVSLSVARDRLDYLVFYARDEEAKALRSKIRSLEEKASAVCRRIGVECSIVRKHHTGISQ